MRNPPTNTLMFIFSVHKDYSLSKISSNLLLKWIAFVETSAFIYLTLTCSYEKQQSSTKAQVRFGKVLPLQFTKLYDNIYDNALFT